MGPSKASAGGLWALRRQGWGLGRKGASILKILVWVDRARGGREGGCGQDSGPRGWPGRAGRGSQQRQRCDDHSRGIQAPLGHWAPLCSTAQPRPVRCGSRRHPGALSRFRPGCCSSLLCDSESKSLCLSEPQFLPGQWVPGTSHVAVTYAEAGTQLFVFRTITGRKGSAGPSKTERR